MRLELHRQRRPSTRCQASCRRHTSPLFNSNEFRAYEIEFVLSANDLPQVPPWEDGLLFAVESIDHIRIRMILNIRYRATSPGNRQLTVLCVVRTPVGQQAVVRSGCFESHDGIEHLDVQAAITLSFYWLLSQPRCFSLLDQSWRRLVRSIRRIGKEGPLNGSAGSLKGILEVALHLPATDAPEGADPRSLTLLDIAFEAILFEKRDTSIS